MGSLHCLEGNTQLFIHLRLPLTIKVKSFPFPFFNIM